MLIGAGIQAVKGAVDFALNKKNLNKLRSIQNAELFELIPSDKHLSSKILLKQTEHRLLSLENTDRETIRCIEEEIIDLMKANLEEKRDELASQNATQLDIANVLITIQKFSHEAIEEIHQLKQQQSSHESETKETMRQFKREQDKAISENESRVSDYEKIVQKLANSINGKFWFLVVYNLIISAGFIYLLAR